jgi:stage II sporulation protein D
MSKVICFLFLLIPSVFFSQLMRIGIFSRDKINRVNVSYSESSYSIYADSTYIGEINKNDFAEIQQVENDKLKLYVGVLEIGVFSSVKLVQSLSAGNMTLTIKNSDIKPRKYTGDFYFNAGKNGIKIINQVHLEDYIAAVVESEGGVGHHLEYYKAQAIMSRTYALKSKNRHSKDGFDLCDQVHCQAYHYKWRFSNSILTAVKATQNEVLIDQKLHLVEGFFHANCGGQTSEPDLIWNESIPYLKTFKDTFCIFTKQAKWEKRIEKSKWVDFFQKKYFVSSEDEFFKSQQFNFKQDTRLAFFVDPKYGIPLRDIRDAFQLKSTLFSCSDDGEFVKLSGKGYGHGVGLCQEGAMKMAKSNFTYQQILKYYFEGTKIINLKYIIDVSINDLKTTEPVTFETYFTNSNGE